jgi:hypothetical protein
MCDHVDQTNYLFRIFLQLMHQSVIVVYDIYDCVDQFFHWCFTNISPWLVVLTILKNMKVNGKDYPICHGKQKMLETTNQVQFNQFNLSIHHLPVDALWDNPCLHSLHCRKKLHTWIDSHHRRRPLFNRKSVSISYDYEYIWICWKNMSTSCGLNKKPHQSQSNP